ncbi:MAG: polysaccharide deacetylase family protein [bacterium]|nr:polysaccharide deacetylase family protein [bacterium]
MSLIRNKFTRNIKGLVLLALNYFSGGGLPILMYHSVSYNKIFFTVTPESFQKQMAWLFQNKYKVISLKELADIIGHEGEVPKKTAVLTFDDSFEDVYLNAFPILKKYGFPASVFIATDFIGREQKNESTGILFKTLDWPQIKEMHESGLIDFEPHTCNHQELTKISLEEAKKEILDSRRIIEEGLNKKCHFFAYPRGKYNQGVVNILKENNFLATLTVNPGRVRKNSNLLELPRQSIDSATGKFQFTCKVK